MEITESKTKGFRAFNPTPNVIEVPPWKIEPGQSVSGISSSLIPAFIKRGCEVHDLETGYLVSEDGVVVPSPVNPILHWEKLDFNVAFEEMFTVVIPTLNREELVKHALDSILSQGYPDTEVIVVDDFSTDNTVSSLMAYRAEHKINLNIVALSRKYNIASVRNTGIDLATTEFIINLDSDDEIAPSGIFNIEQAFRSGADVVYGAFEFKEKKTDLIPWVPGQLERTGCYMLGVRAFRKSLWEALGGYNESLSFSEDLDFLIRAEQAGAKFLGIADTLTKIGSPDERVTTNQPQEVNQDARFSRVEGQNRRRGSWRIPS